MITTGKLFDKRYMPIKLMGTGAFSEVWLADDETIDNSLIYDQDEKRVAIKFYSPDKKISENGLSNFQKEYLLVRNITHDHILPINYFSVYNGNPYLVMPYCKGGNLMNPIIDDPDFSYSELDLAQILNQIASALAYIHKRKDQILHNDIKADNILIRKPNDYVLTDFGIGHKIRTAIITESSTALKKVKYATPSMAPPELNREVLTEKSDIFSLAATIYDIAFKNKLPFPELGTAVHNEAKLPNLPTPYSAGLNAVVKKCLSKNSIERYSAPELVGITQTFLQTGKWPVKTVVNSKNYIGMVLAGVLIGFAVLSSYYFSQKKISQLKPKHSINKVEHKTGLFANNIAKHLSNNDKQLLAKWNKNEKLQKAFKGWTLIGTEKTKHNQVIDCKANTCASVFIIEANKTDKDQLMVLLVAEGDKLSKYIYNKVQADNTFISPAQINGLTKLADSGADYHLHYKHNGRAYKTALSKSKLERL